MSTFLHCYDNGVFCLIIRFVVVKEVVLNICLHIQCRRHFVKEMLCLENLRESEILFYMTSESWIYRGN